MSVPSQYGHRPAVANFTNLMNFATMRFAIRTYFLVGYRAGSVSALTGPTFSYWLCHHRKETSLKACAFLA